MKYNKDNPLRVFTSFSGYDSQVLALKRLKEQNPEFCYEVVGWSEIEETAIQAHNALFPEDKDKLFGDITQIMWDNVPDFDFFFYSPPCTDISAAGLQKGLKRDSGTRSSLIWECEKAIKTKHPKYLMMENVSALVGKKFIRDFESWLSVLDELGYDSFWQLLNTKDFGVPHNRLRVFCISILRTKDDPSPAFSFPKPFLLDKRLADVLEQKVDEKYFLSDEMLARFCEKSLQEDEELNNPNCILNTGDGEYVDYENILLSE